MAYVKVEYGGEFIYGLAPTDRDGIMKAVKIHLPDGSIKKLIGRELSWSDEPVEI